MGYSGQSDGTCRPGPPIGAACGAGKADGAAGGDAVVAFSFGDHPRCTTGATCNRSTSRCMATLGRASRAPTPSSATPGSRACSARARPPRPLPRAARARQPGLPGSDALLRAGRCRLDRKVCREEAVRSPLHGDGRVRRQLLQRPVHRSRWRSAAHAYRSAAPADQRRSPAMTSPETDRRPSEFSYWDNVGGTWVRAVRFMGRAVLGFNLAPPDDVVRTFADSYLRRRSGRRGVGRRGLPRARSRRGTRDRRPGPRARRRLDPRRACLAARPLRRPRARPRLARPERLEALGARVFRRFGTAVFRFAGAARCTATGELRREAARAHRRVHRRIDPPSVPRDRVVLDRRLGPRRFSRARRAGAPPRCASASCTCSCADASRPSRVGRDQWGVPMSQGDSLLTLMGGSFLPGDGMQAMGYRPSTREELRR